jgi:predicted ATPase
MILSKNYVNSQFIIEEPEQNLFPSTQRDLIYHLLEILKKAKQDHRLTLTTHSPYILYALNNCMMASLVGDKMKAEDKAKLKCFTSSIDPQKISIYEIEDGRLKNIQRENGLIKDNYFDQKMKELMDDFYIMLNYYSK